MKVRDAMSRDPRTVDSGVSVVEVARLMRDEDVGLIPIVESDRIVGTVTDRDIAVRVVADGRSAEDVKVADVASRELVTVDPDQDLDEALRLMAKHQVRRLPVMEEDGKLIGIVAQADIAMHADASQAGELLEKISN